MVKRSSKIHYRFQGRICSGKDIFRCCKHRRGRSRYFLSVPVEICGGDENASPIAAKLVFTHSHSNRKDYLVLLSADTDLDEDKITALYGKRWDIEVFQNGEATSAKTLPPLLPHRSKRSPPPPEAPVPATPSQHPVLGRPTPPTSPQRPLGPRRYLPCIYHGGLCGRPGHGESGSRW